MTTLGNEGLGNKFSDSSCSGRELHKSQVFPFPLSLSTNLFLNATLSLTNSFTRFRNLCPRSLDERHPVHNSQVRNLGVTDPSVGPFNEFVKDKEVGVWFLLLP